MFEGNSTEDLTFTFHYSKLSCWRPFYHAHVFFAYMVGLTGLFCFLTRLRPQWNRFHIWFGRAYLISMLWATATSLLITNTGLPIGVLYSFLWVLSGLTVGLMAITLHQEQKKEKMSIAAHLNSIDQTLTSNLTVELPPQQQKGQWQELRCRLLSWKTLHGCMMLLSWINIVGRIAVTPLFEDFECYTYPIYKPGASSHDAKDFQLVPRDNPNYDKQPWAHREVQWALMLFFGPILSGLVVITSQSIHCIHSISFIGSCIVDHMDNSTPAIKIKNLIENQEIMFFK